MGGSCCSKLLSSLPDTLHVPGGSTLQRQLGRLSNAPGCCSVGQIASPHDSAGRGTFMYTQIFTEQRLPLSRIVMPASQCPH